MKPIEDSFQFEIVNEKGEKRAKILAPDYYKHFIKTKTQVGMKGSMHFTFKKPTRTEQQLRYYWVLVGMLAHETGYTSEEMHEWLMIMKFGTKKVTVNGITKEVRKSISNSARMTVSEVIELIEFTLEKCFELNIVVPSKQELGYIDNNKPY